VSVFAFVLLVLGVFGAWESALTICPWTPPTWSQPLLVYGFAILLAWPDWRAALACTGAVGLLHTLALGRDLPPMVLPRRSHRIPTLP
jgi:hydrogenase/urease accessory protein HupE